MKKIKPQNIRTNKRVLFLAKVFNLMSLIFLVGLFSMPNLEAQVFIPSGKLQKGEIIEIAFEVNRADGFTDNGRWKNKALDDNTIEVDFLIENTTSLDPYKSTYKYLMKLLNGGAFQIDMTAALDPMTLRLSDDYSIEYNGDAIYFPANLKEDASLPSAKGVFSVIKPNGSTLLEYHVEITNRKIQLVDLDKLEGKVYQHTYNFQFKNILSNGGNMLIESQEQVQELLSPNMGILQQERVMNIIKSTKEGITDNRSKQSEWQSKISIKSIAKN